MKGICVSKRLLFINILCLLWLPNFCDIKHNGADNQGVETNKIEPNDAIRTENLPSQQEKKIGQQHPYRIVEEDVKPNVEYVNNLENMVGNVIENEENNLESLQNHISENNKQEVLIDLESSRINDVKDEIFHKTVLETPEATTIKATHTIQSKISKEQVDPVILKSNQYASPKQESTDKTVKLTEDATVILSTDIPPKEVVKENIASPVWVKPIKHDETLHHQPHYDGMPSFDEWKKMMLAEQEKGGQRPPSPSQPGKKISSQKRRRNYSSFECGAKIVASNPEAEGTSRILNELVDEYILNPCKTKIWFVIELCETVQATQIELANFELFSSCPKDFAVYSSDNFPTRDWVPLGTFTAAEQRVLQSFELKQEGFGKFIKIELLSHYGTEHYCPLSVVRIFGTSMVDEYEEMEILTSHSHVHEDDMDRLDIVTEDKKSTNIFGSATDAVMNIVKKAAQALGQHQAVEEGKNNETVQEQNSSAVQLCSVVDQSSNKCQDVPIKSDDNTQSLLFPIPSSSMHHSLFRLLHRCDQCVSSRIRYYSSAQPHCRFFQAALGPVIFQTLCDWFKEHPVVIAQESSSHRNKLPLPNLDSSILPTKSPPPQIMRVSVENEIQWTKLISNDSVVPLGPIEATVVQNATKISNDKTASSDEIKLQPPIEPTISKEVVITITNNESETIPESSEAIVSTANIPLEPSSVLLEDALTKTGLQSATTDSESMNVSPGIIDPSSIPDILTDSEVEQMRDFMSDSTSITTEEEAGTIAVTELPIEMRSDKMVNGKTEYLGGKIEPVSVSNIAIAAGQKESVFMRMSNRIKALEINMSLSSQYLQELSQRYRRQMEEMQRAFNRTIGTLNDTARRAAERDLKQQEVLNTLQLQVANLSETVELLLSERSTVFRQMIETHIGLMVIEAIVMITIMSLCVRRISVSVDQVPLVKETVMMSPRLSKRRSSVDSCTPPVARKVKKRSASEEALNAGELLIIEPLPVLIDPMLKVKKKNRKRNKAVQRSNSNPSVPRRSSTSASHCAVKRASHSDGYIRSKLLSYRESADCENCNYDKCVVAKSPDKERRVNGSPLQNLTNGSVIKPIDLQSDRKITKSRERFSLKKLLKFQKRDSI